jgi:cobalt-zinc-cadmium efflux system membrane fusion protein
MSETPEGVVQLTEAEVRAAGIMTAVVGAHQVRQEVSVPGSVQSPDTAHAMVGSFVEGRVIEVLVLAGDVVRRGQPLVEIHSHELSDAQAALRGAEAELIFHRNALERSETLLAAGAVALEEVERRRADLEIVEAEVSRAEDIVDHLNPSLDGDVTVIAPRDGTVFKVQARPGQAVVPGVPLLEMGSTDVLWITAFMPEHTASTLTKGDTVTVRFTAPPGEATAHLVRSGNYVDPTNRSVEMRFELDSIPAGVRPGSFATVDVPSSDQFEGTELPADAAVRMGDRDAVFVVEGTRKFRAVWVSVTPIREGQVAVAGLPPGAEIVTAGAYFLKATLELETEESAEDGS